MGSSYGETYESIKHFVYPDDIRHMKPKEMTNNGIMGISNQKLWVKYRDYYWSMVDQAKPGSITPIGWCVPDIIFEQYFLKDICDNDGYTIKYALSGNDMFEVKQDGANKKYQHVCADKKKHLNKCISLIKKKNFTCYESLRSVWKDKYPEYFNI